MEAERRRPTALLIAGPTASGKSALALRLAIRLHGVLINADSMQVYRDLRILTARPTEAEEARAPHRLFGTVDAATAYSVNAWLTEAAEALADARAAGPMPIFVGGTGLYFKALTQGLSEIPPVAEEVRAQVRAWAADQTPAQLHAALAARDAETAARLRPSDPQRITRALEVWEATGRGLAAWQGSRAAPVLDLQCCAAVKLACDRAELRARLDARVERMMAEGALAEVDGLRRRRLAPDLPAMRALGVPQLMAVLDGTMPREAAVAAVKLETYRYAKRQETFARHQLAEFTPAAPEAAEELLAAACAQFA